MNEKEEKRPVQAYMTPEAIRKINEVGFARMADLRRQRSLRESERLVVETINRLKQK